MTLPARIRDVHRPVRYAASSAPASEAPAPALPHLMLPEQRERSMVGAVVSVLVHIALALLIVAPLAVREAGEVTRIEQGAGGEGPAGGGGGGTGGTGGDPERVRYVAVAPPPPPPAPAAAAPTIVPPVPEVKPEPVPVPEPVAPEPVPPTPVPAATPSQATTTPAPMPGVGGGTGNDGTAGSGPGSGGGVGSGIGTGRGSGIGPGTGGGTQANYPPTAIEVFLPPLPAPANVRGFRVIAEFDVDATGRVLDFKFTETRNGGYNRQLRDVLRQVRFRPGTRPDGTPVRMKAQIEYVLP